MPIETPAADLVRQLRRVGVRPPEKLVERILEQPEAARSSLLELALDIEALQSEPPLRWAPIHALRLLGELHDTAIIEPILGVFPIPLDDPDDEAAALWSDEVPQIIGALGEPAAELLWRWVDDAERATVPRAAAVQSLPYVTAVAPEQRDPIIDGFRSRLATVENPSLAAVMVSALGRLAAASAYGDVMAAYRAGRVDSQMLPAGTARQMLLGGPASTLICATHSLWERYDDHGPREQAVAG